MQACVMAACFFILLRGGEEHDGENARADGG